MDRYILGTIWYPNHPVAFSWSFLPSAWNAQRPARAVGDKCASTNASPKLCTGYMIVHDHQLKVDITQGDWFGITECICLYIRLITAVAGSFVAAAQGIVLKSSKNYWHIAGGLATWSFPFNIKPTPNIKYYLLRSPRLEWFCMSSGSPTHQQWWKNVNFHHLSSPYIGTRLRPGTPLVPPFQAPCLRETMTLIRKSWSTRSEVWPLYSTQNKNKHLSWSSSLPVPPVPIQ